VVELGYEQTTCIIEWRPELAATSSKGTGDPNPWRSLKVFRSAVQTALADHGKESRPFGNDGPLVRAVPLNFVRSEFLASYPADKGDSEEQKQDAKRKAFTRQLKSASDRSLVCSREVGGVDILWLVGDEGH
jgi:hypothetical protein